MTHYRRQVGFYSLFLLVNIFLSNQVFANSIIIENNLLKYEISPDGENLHFIEKLSGKEYLNVDTISYCSYIIKDSKTYKVTDVRLKKNKLELRYGNTGVKVKIAFNAEKDHINFKVLSVKGKVEVVNFINIPLTLDGLPYESFAACVLSMNLHTHVKQLPALQNHLWASCYKQFGIKGAEVELIGIPQDRVLSLIREIMSKAKGVPFSDKGGAWAQLNKEGYGSYLMNFGTLTEKTVDDVINQCRMLGFNQVISHGGGDFFKHGEFELNKEKWPDGWQSFKRINDKLRVAGISSILLTYTFFIDKNSKHVSPVPSDDLGYFEKFTLAKPCNENDTVIILNEPTTNLTPITGYFVRNSKTVRIGSELIEFSGVTTTPPYKLTGCIRGVNGTRKSIHSLNDEVFHLKEMFGRFVPGPDTELFDFIAKQTAQISDEAGFDGLYFDAIDGNDLLGGKENSWYYGTKFIFEVAKNLKKTVGMEMCDMPHHYWHYSSRWQAWDKAVRGYKRFVDVKLAAIKSHDHRHGEWMGYTKDIERLAPLENGCLLLPLHLGWWSNNTWNPPQVEPTFTDDIEYLCAKMIGNNAGLSMLGGVDDETLKANPAFNRLIPIIRQYEELRNKNYFNDSIRKILREPGKEFSLVRKDSNEWTFRRKFYKKHKVEGVNHSTSNWVVENEFETQPIKLRIEPLMSVKPFESTDNVLLTDFSTSNEFIYKDAAKGVAGELKTKRDEISGIENNVGVFNATSQGSSPKEGSWIRFEKKIEPFINLTDNQALGVWIKGDGNGELLNLRLESPEYASMGARGDHFIKIDFTGWKYFELVEIESSRFNDYIWPNEYFNVYNSYFYTVIFDKIDKLQLWYNNVPKGGQVNCTIGPIKALPLIPIKTKNPEITLGGETITFQVEMESGMYLEFNSEEDCKLYGSKGEFIRDVKVVGKAPSIRNGKNVISFDCENNAEEINPRFQITVIGEGDSI